MHRHKVNLNGILRNPKGRRIFQGLKLLKSPVQWQVLDWSTAGKLQTGGVQQDPPNSPRGTQNCEEFVGVFCLLELWQFISHQLLVNMSFIVQLTMIGWQYTIEYRLHFWNVLVRFCSCKFKWSCSAVRWGQTSQSPQASRIRWEKLVSCSLGFQNCCSHRMSNINCIRAVRLFFSSQKQKRLASDKEYSRVTHITKRQHPNDVRTFVFSTAWMHCSTDLCYRSQVQAKGKELQFHVVSIF